MKYIFSRSRPKKVWLANPVVYVQPSQPLHPLPLHLCTGRACNDSSGEQERRGRTKREVCAQQTMLVRRIPFVRARHFTTHRPIDRFGPFFLSRSHSVAFASTVTINNTTVGVRARTLSNTLNVFVLDAFTYSRLSTRFGPAIYWYGQGRDRLQHISPSDGYTLCVCAFVCVGVLPIRRSDRFSARSIRPGGIRGKSG